ncbi:MAG: OmpA family protein [Spirochaetales bacterium]|nr:OmpA family protein [Calditrichota bacterium]MBN2657185.1 OmpA family protein [Spirochaetales bacterium]
MADTFDEDTFDEDIFQESDLSFDQSISDLMSALLMIFILILMVALMKLTSIFEEKTNIAERYQSLQTDLYQDLYEEFKENLEQWGAEIEKETLTIRFKEPDVLFEPNSAQLRNKFRTILKDFFPRYLSILYKEKYKNSIAEIRIEGHTANPGDQYPFMNGMLLSQDRTNSVLDYVLSGYVLKEKELKDWCEKYLISIGKSHSQPILNDDGTPNWSISRRVEFQIRTDAENELKKLLEVK